MSARHTPDNPATRILRLLQGARDETIQWEAAAEHPDPWREERRQRPSDALFIEFLLQELRDERNRTADVEALQARAGWRRVG